MSTTIPPRIQSQAAREQYAGRRMFSQPVPLPGTPAQPADREVERIKATIFSARDRHAELLEDPDALDRVIQAELEKKPTSSYSQAMGEVLAIGREVRSLAAQFEDSSIEDAEVARVALAHANASASDGTLTFAQALRKVANDA